MEEEIEQKICVSPKMIDTIFFLSHFYNFIQSLHKPPSHHFNTCAERFILSTF